MHFSLVVAVVIRFCRVHRISLAVLKVLFSLCPQAGLVNAVRLGYTSVSHECLFVAGAGPWVMAVRSIGIVIVVVVATRAICNNINKLC